VEIDTAATAAVADAAKAAKSAHRAAVLTLFAVAVAVLVLAIDNSIKRSIVSEAQQVREIFRQFQEATDGLKAAVQGSADSGADNRTADDEPSSVDEPARARAAANSHAGAGKTAPVGRKGGPRARP
jgi:hypothetical protein